jgi:hypothetical protein
VAQAVSEIARFEATRWRYMRSFQHAYLFPIAGNAMVKSPSTEQPATEPALKFWEKPNTIAIYSAIVALFIVLVLSAVPSVSPPMLKIDNAQIFIIVVIAALLLFRYYNTLKLGTLLELSNAEKAAEADAEAANDDKEETKDVLSGVEDALEEINRLIGKAEASEDKIAVYKSKIEQEKDEMESEFQKIIPQMRGKMLNMTKADIGMFDNLANQIAPKIDDIAQAAENLPNLETATSEELGNLKNNLEVQKARLLELSANIDKRAQRANQRRQRLAAMRNNLA